MTVEYDFRPELYAEKIRQSVEDLCDNYTALLYEPAYEEALDKLAQYAPAERRQDLLDEVADRWTAWRVEISDLAVQLALSLARVQRVSPPEPDQPDDPPPAA